MNVEWRTTIYTLQGVVGIITNILVVLVIVKTTSLRKIDHMKLIVNQSIIDSITSVCLIFSYLNMQHMGVRLSYEQGGAAAWMLCFFWRFDRPLWGFFLSSTANLLMMTIVKYLQIVHPIWYKTKFTTQHFWVGVVLCWVSGPLYACTAFAAKVKVINGKCNLSAWPNEMMGKVIGVLTYFLQVWFPFMVFVFCYTRMLLVIRKRWKQVGPSEATQTKESTSVSQAQPQVNQANQMAKNTRVQKNIVMTLLTVSLCFIFCWAWRQTQFLLENLGIQETSDNYGGFIHEFGTLAIFTNILTNPLIYFISLRNFRQAAKELFRKS